MLTDLELRALKPADMIYKVADQRGLYAAVTLSGLVSFRFDYRLNGRREFGRPSGRSERLQGGA